MADITPDEPLFLADSIVTLGTDNYQAAISSAKFVANAPTKSTFKGLTPTAVYTRQGVADWDLVLTFVQDPDSETSLSNYLHDHEGEVVDAVFEPNNGESSWAATVTLAAGDVGGDVEQWGTSTVTMGSTKPSRTAAV